MFAFEPGRRKRAEELVALSPEKRAALLPILWLVQEQEGFVPPAAAAVVADLVGITEAEVVEVVSFYTLFNRKPVGRHHLQVCTGVCCRLRGSDELVAHLCSRLGIGVGETTPDGAFTLSTVECLGSCGTAPMMQVGDAYYEDLDGQKVDDILARLSS